MPPEVFLTHRHDVIDIQPESTRFSTCQANQLPPVCVDDVVSNQSQFDQYSSPVEADFVVQILVSHGVRLHQIATQFSIGDVTTFVTIGLRVGDDSFRLEYYPIRIVQINLAAKSLLKGRVTPVGIIRKYFAIVIGTECRHIFHAITTQDEFPKTPTRVIPRH